jgi:hypothetical protein
MKKRRSGQKLDAAQSIYVDFWPKAEVQRVSPDVRS